MPDLKTTSIQFYPDTWKALNDFCDLNDYMRREVIDVALREYLKLPDPVLEPEDTAA